jgi:uncharacterized protein (TIGR00369 family)
MALEKEALIHFFEEQIPFNKLLQMKVEQLSLGEHGLGQCRVRIPFQESLIGDIFRPALHGGVLSTLADTAGGLAVFAGIGTMRARVSTVDLRVDYYEPGALEEIYGEAEVVRLGNRVGVARIRLVQGERLVAEGKGVYNIKKPQEQE